MTHDDPVAHVHEVAHPEPASPDTYVPDEAVKAFVTTVTLALAHAPGDGDPYAIVKRVTETLEGLGLRGVVVGVASVELRGDGGLVGL